MSVTGDVRVSHREMSVSVTGDVRVSHRGMSVSVTGDARVSHREMSARQSPEDARARLIVPCPHCRRMEDLAASREELDRQKKLLAKRKPSSAESARKRAGSAPQAVQQNGGEFVRPEDPGRLSGQEYYEADEIIKVGGGRGRWRR